MSEPAVTRDAQAVLTIDLDALGANWRLLAGRAAPAECAAVIKADAYGTGIEAAAPALARAGCRTFFTAHVSEGTRARAALRAAGFADEAVRLFVLNGFSPKAADLSAYAAARLGPVLCSRGQVEAFRLGGGAGAVPRPALHVDTGMNRAGLDPTEAAALTAEDVAGLDLALVMSHLVSAEEPDNPINVSQAAAFAAVRAAPALAGLPASLCNSSGLFLPGRPVLDLVRPGYALYGGNPCPGRPNPMRPVVQLAARVLQTRWIEPGASVGYGGRWTAFQRTLVATVGVGYADGLLRGARSCGEGDGPVAWAGAVPCPLIGRVSMDLSLVDVTDAPTLRPGDTLDLLNARSTVDDLGAQCGTIGYEILTSLGGRYARVCRGDGTGARQG